LNRAAGIPLVIKDYKKDEKKMSCLNNYVSLMGVYKTDNESEHDKADKFFFSSSS